MAETYLFSSTSCDTQAGAKAALKAKEVSKWLDCGLTIEKTDSKQQNREQKVRDIKQV